MDAVLKVLCEVRPLQNYQYVNARLADAGADFTFEEFLEEWPDSVPRFGVILGSHRGVVSAVFFAVPIEGLVIRGIAIGDELDAVLERSPKAQHLRRTDRKDGSHCDSYIVDPDSVVLHSFTAEDGRVINQNFKVAGDTETRIKLFDEASQERPFEDIWAERVHGHSWRGDPTDQLRSWASLYANDFHGNDWTKLAEWLVYQSTPADRHAFALAYNWDHGTAPLAWIVNQPDTCLATLAEIFWLSEPGYYEDHRLAPQNPVDTDVFDLLWDLRDVARKRVSDGSGATGSEFAFAPGISASDYASQDPQSFFVPVLCWPISGAAPEGLPENWPIPIN